MKQRVYLDNSATTAVDPRVVELMRQALSEWYGNPSSIHAEGRKVRAHIEQARKFIARAIGASIGEVFFTSGGTESNNTILKGAARDLGVRRIISARTEHHCVLRSLEALERDEKVEIVYLPLDERGRVNPDELSAALAASAEKTLVSLMHANNEIGAMIDLEEISGICQQYEALFHTDTVQTMGYYPIDLARTRVNFLSGSAHKFHGPKGVGFMYINGDNKLRPFIDGGSQERNMRGGTENVYGIVGMAKALELAIEHMEERRAHISALRERLARRLLEAVPGIIINGDWDGRSHYKILNVSFPPSPKSEMLLFSLDVAGICASGGSACSSGADAGSHVLAALPGQLPEYTAIRFSLSHLNTLEEMEYTAQQVAAILQPKQATSRTLG
jgi:cysteine desulfurase